MVCCSSVVTCGSVCTDHLSVRATLTSWVTAFLLFISLFWANWWYWEPLQCPVLVRMWNLVSVGNRWCIYIRNYPNINFILLSGFSIGSSCRGGSFNLLQVQKDSNKLHLLHTFLKFWLLGSCCIAYWESIIYVMLLYSACIQSRLLQNYIVPLPDIFLCNIYWMGCTLNCALLQNFCYTVHSITLETCLSKRWSVQSNLIWNRNK